MSPEIRLVALILLGAIFTLGLGIAVGRWMIQRHESRALVEARAQLNRRRAADVRNEREVAVLTQARLVDAADLDSLRARLDDAQALTVRVGQVEQQSMIIERLYRQVAELREQLAGRGVRGVAAVPAQAAAPQDAVPDTTADAVTPDAAGPATAATDTAATDTLATDTLATDTLATDTAAIDTLATDTAAIDTVAPAAAEPDTVVDDTGATSGSTADEESGYPLIGGTAPSDSVDITAFEAANRIANGVPKARNGAVRKNAPTAAHDDLTLIEGIGPRIQELCYAAGITTWREMADIPVDRLREILAAAGPRYAGHQPQSWPGQAASLIAGHRDHAMAGEARVG